MESASIKQVDERQVVPNLVTADDLKKELGEWVVAVIQKGKIINILTLQNAKLNAVIAEQKIAVDKIPAIQSSNKQLEEKNTKLAEALKDVRKERDAAVAEKAVAVKEAVAEKAVAATSQVSANKALLACKKEMERLQALYDGSQVERNQLNDTIDKEGSLVVELEEKIIELEKKIKDTKKKPHKKTRKAA